MDRCTATSGFLIEKTFTRMCREFLTTRERCRPYLLNKGRYSTPRTDVPPEQMPKQYRGLQREPLQGWVELLRGSGVVEPADDELEASLFLEELLKVEKAECDIIFTLADVQEVITKIKPPVEREIVWARRMDGGDSPPPGAELLGYEPSTFYPPTCESAVAEGMFFTYPVDFEEELARLEGYHEKLNPWGLFDDPSDAEDYLEVYLSCLPPSWDQHLYAYYIVEVRSTAHSQAKGSDGATSLWVSGV